MKFTPKKIYHGFAPEVQAPLFEAPIGSNIIIKNIFIENTGDSDSTVNLYVAKKGQEVDTSKSLFTNAKYVSNEKENISEMFIALEPGDVLYGQQTTAQSCILYISGIEQTN